MYINCLNSAFSTTDHGCISHAIKLPIDSTKFCHHLLSFGSGLTCSITFFSVDYDCSTILSFSHSALAIAHIHFDGVVTSAQEDLLFLQYKTSDKQSSQTALSFTGVPSSLLKNPKCFHTWLLPVGLCTILFSNAIFTTQQFKCACVNINVSIHP